MAGRHRKPAARGRHRRPTSPGRYLASGAVAVAVLGLGGVGAHAALSGGSSGSPPPAAQVTPAPTVPSQPVRTPSVAPTTPATPVPTSSPHAAPKHPAALALTVTGPVSWVEVTRPDG